MKISVYSDRFCIRTLNRPYAEAVQDYLNRNAAFFQPYCPKWPDNFSDLEEVQKRLSGQWWQMSQKKMLRFFVFHQSDKAFQQIIADITYSNIVWGPFRSCFLGYKVDQRFNGLGVATEAITEANNFLFKNWGLHRIEANIMPSNLASQGVVRKLGFEKEGLAKAFLKINGKWEDHYRYALRKEGGE